MVDRVLEAADLELPAKELVLLGEQLVVFDGRWIEVRLAGRGFVLVGVLVFRGRLGRGGVSDSPGIGCDVCEGNPMELRLLSRTRDGLNGIIGDGRLLYWRRHPEAVAALLALDPDPDELGGNAAFLAASRTDDRWHRAPPSSAALRRLGGPGRFRPSLTTTA